MGIYIYVTPMKLSDKNSEAAADYAKKKKEQLEKARRLKAERESKSMSGGGERHVMGMGYESQASKPSSAGQLVSVYRNLEQSGMEPFADYIKISKSNYEYVDAEKYRELSREKAERNSRSLPRSMLNDGSNEPPRVVTSYISGTNFEMSRSRNVHAPHADSRPFFAPPSPPEGTQVNVSDRPLLCMSSNKRNEVIVGSADHALYSISLTSLGHRPPPAPQTMYSKRNGHADWITGVAHLANGKVMDLAVCSNSTGADGDVLSICLSVCLSICVCVYVCLSGRCCPPPWTGSCACGTIAAHVVRTSSDTRGLSPRCSRQL